MVVDVEVFGTVVLGSVTDVGGNVVTGEDGAVVGGSSFALLVVHATTPRASTTRSATTRDMECQDTTVNAVDRSSGRCRQADYDSSRRCRTRARGPRWQTTLIPGCADDDPRLSPVHGLCSAGSDKPE